MGILDLPPPLPPGNAPYVLVENGGGDFDKFVGRAAEIGDRRVIIKGLCGSSCTVIALSAKNACAEPDAELWFHQVSFVRNGKVEERSELGTAKMLSMYPFAVQAWLAEKGGLTADWIKAKGKELRRFLPLCGRPSGRGGGT